MIAEHSSSVGTPKREPRTPGRKPGAAPAHPAPRRKRARVADVTTTSVGTELTADASSGATSITVKDTSRFCPGGGKVVLNDQTLVYTALDDDSGELTLSTPLDDDAEQGDAVSTYDPKSSKPLKERRAKLSTEDGEDEGDPLDAELDAAVSPQLRDGTRAAGEGELVEYEEVGSRVRVVNVLADEQPTSQLPSGGTTGQVLAKASDEDYDLGWITVSTGTGELPPYEEVDDELSPSRVLVHDYEDGPTWKSRLVLTDLTIRAEDADSGFDGLSFSREEASYDSGGIAPQGTLVVEGGVLNAGGNPQLLIGDVILRGSTHPTGGTLSGRQHDPDDTSERYSLRRLLIQILDRLDALDGGV